jgi:hypothetical protein
MFDYNRLAKRKKAELITIPWKCIERWRYSAIDLYLGTRWRCMVSFKHRPSYPCGYICRYPMDRRLGPPQEPPGRWGVQEGVLLLQGIKPRPSSPKSIAVPIALPRFHNCLGVGNVLDRRVSARMVDTSLESKRVTQVMHMIWAIIKQLQETIYLITFAIIFVG